MLSVSNSICLHSPNLVNRCPGQDYAGQMPSSGHKRSTKQTEVRQKNCGFGAFRM